MTHRERKKRRRDIAAYLSRTGRTRAEAAEHFGASKSTVETACRENGMGLSHRKRGDRRRDIAAYRDRTQCTLTAAAEHFGVSVQTAMRACCNHGMIRFHKKANAEAADRRRGIAAYRSRTNCTLAEAARHFGVSVSIVAEACRENGVHVPRCHEVSASMTARNDTILEYRRNHCTLQEIGNRFGLSPQRIHQIVAIDSANPNA